VSNDSKILDANVFEQAANIYSLKFTIEFAELSGLIAQIDELELNYEYFEKKISKELENSPNDKWQIIIYSNLPTQLIIAEKFIAQILDGLNLTTSFSRKIVPDKDWVAEVQNNFKPICINEFFIHTENFPDNQNFINIIINPDRAFGTGEHQTTQLCLQAISYLKNILKIKPSNCLDLGCGSGILSIAAEKLFNCKTYASDIDHESIEVMNKNNLLNKTHIISILSDGFHNELLFKSSPYDIIISNILAKPLIDMSAQIMASTSINGYIILSGFLEKQVSEIKQAYQACKLIKQFQDQEWQCLIFKKLIN
jgi:ribosomal protein L11 methyltransferase